MNNFILVKNDFFSIKKWEIVIVYSVDSLKTQGGTTQAG